MADRDGDDWTTVRYGGGRRRVRYTGPRPHSPPTYRSTEPRRTSRSETYRRSYASVAREWQTRQPPHRPASRSRPRGFNFQQYTRNDRNYDYRRDHSDQRFWRRRDTESSYWSRDRFTPGTEWWRAPRVERRAPPFERRADASAPRSEDPNFQTKVRLLHRLIKATHHLQNVSRGDPPITITRMTQTLTALIKPATPSENTLDLISGNAKNWELTTMLILKDHHLEVMEKEIANFMTFPTFEWKRPFAIAADQARRNLGRRLQGETVQQAEALLLARLAEKERATVGQTVDNSAAEVNRTAPEVDLGGDPPPPGSAASFSPPSSPPKQVVVQAQTHPRPAVSPVQELAIPPPLPPRQGRIGPTKRSVATMTDFKSDWSISPESQREDRETFPLLVNDIVPLSPKQQRKQPWPQISSALQREESISWPATPPAGRCNELHLLDVDPCPSTSTPLIPETPQVTDTPLPSAPPTGVCPCEELLLDLDGETLEGLLAQDWDPSTPPGKSSPPTLHKKHSLLPLNVSGSTSKTAASIFVESPRSDLSITTRRPTRHISTLQKSKNWSLSVRHKWLILGDSNVARIPPYQIPHLQIDGFPGATFTNLRSVLAKIDTDPTVEIVILSIGLNNRAQNRTETSILELQRLMLMANAKFPHASIWIPVISFSRSLPHREQNQLCSINKYIMTHYQFIPELPRSQFSVERDRVHWTHPTAARLLDHWTTLVN